MFSIIVPFYNGSKYIEQTIDSILNQTIKSYELILIDDNSHPDESKFLSRLVSCKSYGNITLLINDTNLGLMSSLNRGISISTGTNIVVLGQDDLISPSHLFSLIRYINKIDSNFAAIFCDATYLNGAKDTNILVRGNQLNRFTENCVSFSSLMKWNYIVSVGICINKKVLLKVGGFETKFSNHGEWLTWLKLIKHEKFFLNRSIFAKYRRHNSNLTSRMISSGALQKYKYENYVNNYAFKISDKKLSIIHIYISNRVKNFCFLLYRKLFQFSYSHYRITKC